jgi:beta-glucosidase
MKTTARPASFPSGFLWGCSTSSYQIEGSTEADGRGRSIWDAFCREPGRVAYGQTGDVACDSYRRADEDVALLSELGANAYRFSVAWPRVQPLGQGKVLSQGLDYYSRLVDALLASGIEPWVTLYHWDLPLALGEKGGWTERDTAYRFSDYAEIVYRALGDRVRHWVTLNEPWCSSFLGYRTGEHAPGLRDEKATYRAVHHLMLAHGLARAAFRSSGLDGEIGLVINAATPRPATSRPEDVLAARRASVERTGLWLDPVFGRGYPEEYLAAHGAALPIEEGDLGVVAGDLDFIGLNYYNEDVVEAAPVGPEAPEGFRYVQTSREKTEMGWDIVPQGIRRCLDFMSEGWAPKALYVTENGAAFADSPDASGRIRDRDRIEYLKSHLEACLDAMGDGVPLKGYFAWSLLDNFEWAHGYGKKFGLVAVDPGTGKRTKKDSFFFFRDAAAGFLE